MKRVVLYLIFLVSAAGLRAQSVADSIVASLLTCSPGTEVYSLYGHTGLRLQNRTKDLDVVFNYGVFDFRRPNFTWHFILGECDYEVMPFPFDAFMHEYRQRGSSVVEQTLNLTSEEANRLFAQLIINCQPENKTYRYNFLLRNCTTMARDQIEHAVNGTVVYAEQEEPATYRQLLHGYTGDFPWNETGCDLLLGAACDTMLSDRAAQFLPEQLMSYFSTAQVFDAQNNRKPLVSSTQVLLEPREQAKPEAFPLSPLMVGLLVLLFMILVALVERWTRRMFWGIDILFMTAQGVVGLLLCFVFLFSSHPTVNTNWQIWIFNPLPLFCMPWVVRSAIKRKRCPFHYLNVLWIVLFLVFMAWIPQSFPVLTLLLALALLTRPISYLTYYNRKQL